MMPINQIDLLFNVSEINEELIPVLKKTWYDHVEVMQVFDAMYVLSHWYCYWLDRSGLAFLSENAFTYPVFPHMVDPVRYPKLDPFQKTWIERRLYQIVTIPTQLYENQVNHLMVSPSSLVLTIPLYSQLEQHYARHIAYYKRG